MLTNSVLVNEIKLDEGKSKTENNGYISTGIIKKSNNQVKKHISQMSIKEINFLEESLSKVNINNVTYSEHLLKKDMSFNKEYVTEILRSEKLKEMIVEYNETTIWNGTIDHRVLLRETEKRKVCLKTKKGKEISFANLCIVLSLDSSRLVTAYWNKIEDTHSTMDWRRYNENLKIC